MPITSHFRDRPRRPALWLALMSVITWSGWGCAAPPVEPEVSARAAVLIEARSGELLFAKAPYQSLPPASTTKVLTTLLALERLDANARVPISSAAAAAEPSRLGLASGEVMYVQDLLYGAMLKSGNDAAEVLAESVSGSVSAFAELMNKRAWQMGARGSHFLNPHGLPIPGHYSTAYDIAMIFRQAMLNPQFAEIVRTRAAGLRVESPGLGEGWRVVPVHNSNRLLLSYAGIQGGKTGYTSEAKNCFVGEAKRENVALIVAVLGSPRRDALWRDVGGLLDYGFARYGLAATGQATAPLPDGAAESVSVTGDN